jgi:hypothetical protein
MPEKTTHTLAEERDQARLRPHLRTRTRRTTLRACLGCGKPSATTRCPDCAATLATYDGEHRTNARIVRLTTTNCWICGKPGTTGDPITADHIRALIDGGTNELSNYAGAHRSCNSRRGATRAT